MNTYAKWAARRSTEGLIQWLGGNRDYERLMAESAKRKLLGLPDREWHEYTPSKQKCFAALKELTNRGYKHD